MHVCTVCTVCNGMYGKDEPGKKKDVNGSEIVQHTDDSLFYVLCSSAF